MPDSYQRIRLLKDCPCGSGRNYGECCHPYHKGKAYPETAEQLMRSRYCAYFFRLTDYLVSTHHPDTRDKNLRDKLEEEIYDLNWVGLRIINSSKGQADDKTGKVEFSAGYFYLNEKLDLHEKSRFRRFKGKWKYLDAKG
ncbi:YchJ family protein [Sulfuriroseicoccus oceanibius]|uniref:UPF0225 protein G3M56_013555 n=1 Tax=Sulfuriroseicoccus oceanibius TaxID=2707525 RepID=A0A6B3L937_9BACT|nr:YchJ family metal-binding protein [Sulfuriroseicoccus oceanibius]QQL44884.1 SEC-C domain-containing protein [Sulfuriroseicoccus oceanibius]